MDKINLNKYLIRKFNHLYIYKSAQLENREVVAGYARTEPHGWG